MDNAKPFHRAPYCPLGNRNHHLRTVRGFSLLEVLISIVILSFGILGMVGLQATALQSNRDAKLQSTAASLAKELAEIMRSDKYAYYATTDNPYLKQFTAPLTPVTESHCLDVSSSNGCGTDQSGIANSQMTEWLTRVASELPGARVTVCVDKAPFDANGIPQWDCTPDTSASTFIKIGWTRGSTDRSAKNNTPLERASVPSIIFPVTVSPKTGL